MLQEAVDVVCVTSVVLVSVNNFTKKKAALIVCATFKGIWSGFNSTVQFMSSKVSTVSFQDLRQRVIERFQPPFYLFVCIVRWPLPLRPNRKLPIIVSDLSVWWALSHRGCRPVQQPPLSKARPEIWIFFLYWGDGDVSSYHHFCHARPGARARLALFI